MYVVGDTVVAYEQQETLGTAQIVDICRDQDELGKYYHVLHPMYKKFLLGVLNSWEVYIVDFAGDAGQGGYFKQNLRLIEHQKS